MNGHHDREKAIQAASDLTGALKDVHGELSRLNAYGRRNRHLIWWLTVSLVLDVILTVAVAVTAIQAHNANTSAAASLATSQAVRASSITACALGNQARAQQLQLWSHIVAISKPPPRATKKQAAAEKRTTTAFLAYIRRDFAPRNCAKIYRASPGRVH